MVALPDMPLEAIEIIRPKTQAPAAIAFDAKRSALKPALFMFFGVVFMSSALGLWMVPAEAGDAGARLVKLVASSLFLVVGLVLMKAVPAREAVSYELDMARGELREMTVDAEGGRHVAKVHDLFALDHVELVGGVLTGEDAEGRKLFSLPVEDVRARSALRAALMA